ncbi:hypothetical protein V5O48_015575 [Marasmius crinis-equi]|uniref:Uncharacterized protein n=1 Tax=Marasmius crinis-equi TaxID=585013 RepID=A0ABR3EU55_9AGAR
MTGQKGCEGFYDVVGNIIKHLKLQPTEDPTRSAKKAHKRRMAELKETLKHKYKQASQVGVSSSRGWMKYQITPSGQVEISSLKLEDALVVVGNIVKTIGEAPGLASLKVAGSLLGQIGDLVNSTIQTNKAECTSTLNHVASILGDLAWKMQRSARKPTEDMKDNIGALERTLVHVHDYVLELQQEKGWRRAARFVFAHKTQEELASLRKELERTQLTFVTSSMVTVRLELPAQSSNPVKNETQSAIVVSVTSGFFYHSDHGAV